MNAIILPCKLHFRQQRQQHQLQLLVSTILSTIWWPPFCHFRTRTSRSTSSSFILSQQQKPLSDEQNDHHSAGEASKREVDQENEKPSCQLNILLSTNKSINNNNNDFQNHWRYKEFFDHLARRLEIRDWPDDWYKVTREQVNRFGGKNLRGSWIYSLAATYPHYDFLPWRFASVPRGFWSEPSNLRRFFDWVASQLSFSPTDAEGWYKVRKEQIEELGGKGCLKYSSSRTNDKSKDTTTTTTTTKSSSSSSSSSSWVDTLMQAYPEIEWQPWRFSTVPRRFWHDLRNQRRFFDWAAQQLRIDHPDGWYAVTVSDLDKLGGCGLLSLIYNDSISEALARVYPEVEWHPWRFSLTPHGFWDDPQNQRRFFAWAARELGVRPDHWPEDWYRVRREDIDRLGGSGLVATRYAGGSWIDALATAFPEYEWHPWKFATVPRNFFAPPKSTITTTTTREDNENDNNVNNNNNNNNLRRLIDFIEKELEIRHLDEWYRVSVDQLERLGASYHCLRQNGGLCAVLKRLYPDHPWDEHRFYRNRGKKSSQRWMAIAIRTIFPNEEVLEEYVHPSLKFGDSGDHMQLDVFVPRLSLAFEYHGEQHYTSSSSMHFFASSSGSGASIQQQRDEDKIAACHRAGITLVVVPYWWDRRVASLAETIRREVEATPFSNGPLIRDALLQIMDKMDKKRQE